MHNFLSLKCILYRMDFRLVLQEQFFSQFLIKVLGTAKVLKKPVSCNILFRNQHYKKSC